MVAALWLLCSDVDICLLWSIEWKEENERLAYLQSGTIALPLFYLPSAPPKIIVAILLLFFFFYSRQQLIDNAVEPYFNEELLLLLPPSCASAAHFSLCWLLLSDNSQLKLLYLVWKVKLWLSGSEARPPLFIGPRRGALVFYIPNYMSD